MLRSYPNAREIVWCQEEPQNQGAWYQIRHRLQELRAAARRAVRGPRAGGGAATGFAKIHEAEQQALVEAALRRLRPRTLRASTTRLTASQRRAQPPTPMRKSS